MHRRNEDFVTYEDSDNRKRRKIFGDVHQETLFLVFCGARDVTHFGACHTVARISLNDGKMRMKHGFCWLIGVWKILMKFHVDVCREISQLLRLT